MNLDEHLATKTNDNGNFSETAEYAQGLKFLLRQGQNWSAISPLAKEALENIATRISMILNGDHQRADHWNKIAAYARLRGAGLEPAPEIGQSVETVLKSRFPLHTMKPAELEPDAEFIAVAKNWAPRT